MIAVNPAISRFLAWWFWKFAGCVPDRLRKLLRYNSSLLVITPNGLAAHFISHCNGRASPARDDPLSAASRRALFDAFGVLPTIPRGNCKCTGQDSAANREFADGSGGKSARDVGIP